MFAVRFFCVDQPAALRAKTAAAWCSPVDAEPSSLSAASVAKGNYIFSIFQTRLLGRRGVLLTATAALP
jgi:hypothetical protein